MLDSINIGRYYDTKSNIHLLNPLSKIICLLVYVCTLLLNNDIVVNGTLLVLVLLVIFESNVPIKVYLKPINSLKFLMIFIILINLIMHISFLTTILTLIKIVGIVLYTSLFTLTTTPNEITYGLNQLLSPLSKIGLKVNKLSLAITLALRFIPTIINETNKILKSLATRGLDYHNSNLKDKLYAIKAIIFPIFILSFRNADNLANIMEVRLYDLNKKRSNYHISKWHFFDTYLIIVHLAIFILILMKEVVR